MKIILVPTLLGLLGIGAAQHAVAADYSSANLAATHSFIKASSAASHYRYNPHNRYRYHHRYRNTQLYYSNSNLHRAQYRYRRLNAYRVRHAQPSYNLLAPYRHHYYYPRAYYSHNAYYFAAPAHAAYRVKSTGWHFASNGNVPHRSLVAFHEKGTPHYRCRVRYQGSTYYGGLRAGKGCIIKAQGKMLTLGRYWVKIRY